MGMINLLVEKRKMTPSDAYGLTKYCGDWRFGATRTPRERPLPNAEDSLASPEVISRQNFHGLPHIRRYAPIPNATPGGR